MARLSVRAGISKVLVAIVVAAMVVAAGVTGYFLLTSSGAEPAPPPTADSLLPATADTSPPTPLYVFLFRTFTSVTMQNTFTGSNFINHTYVSSPPVFTETASFRKLGTANVDGVPTEEVNFSMASNYGRNSSIIGYYSAGGAPQRLVWRNQTCNVGQIEGHTCLLVVGVASEPLDWFLGYNTYFSNATAFSQLRYQRTSTETFGNVTMTVFTYGYHDPTGTLVGSLEPADVTVSIGRIPRSAYCMVVYVGGQVTYSANESGFVTDALISASAA